MKEEADCLRVMIEVVKRQKGYVDKLDPSLKSLIKIEEAGLLEPFILINRSDKDITNDYQGYLSAHRDKVRRYLNEFVVPKRLSPADE